MAKGVRVKVWGDYALFSRPEMKVERFEQLATTEKNAKTHFLCTDRQVFLLASPHPSVSDRKLFYSLTQTIVL